MLKRASLQVAEANCEPGILLSQLPKYLDAYTTKYLVVHALPHLAFIFYLFIFVVPGMEPRGILSPSYTSSPFLFFIWNRVSLSCGGLTK